MPPYADPFLCPGCGGRLPVDVTRCPGCRLDLRNPLAAELLLTLRNADDLLARLRVESARQPAAVAVEHTPYPAPRISRPARSHGLSGASVPRILLSLGALCLLVAAVIFLAVAWTWLGVGGRTAVLVALTALSGGLGTVMSRRGLRVAAESLTTVSLGLLTLDVVGADHAGWLGDLSSGGLVALTSAVVLAAALALTATAGLGAPQLIAAGALSGVGLGLLATTERWQVVAGLVVLGYAALAAAAELRRWAILRVAALVGGGLWWAGFATSALEEATDHATWSELWLDGHGYALLAASSMVLLPLVTGRAPGIVVRGLVTCAAAALTVTVAIPAVDESATALAVVGLAVLAVWTAVAVVTPLRWRVVPAVSMALGAAPVIVVVLVLAAQAAGNAFATAPPFTSTAGLRLGDPEPVAAPLLLAIGVAALVAAGTALARRTPGLLVGGGGIVAAGAIGTVALHPVPIWVLTFAAATLGALLLADAVRRADLRGAVEAGAGGAALLFALVVALPSAGLTTLVAALLTLAAVVVHRSGAFPGAVEAGGLALPAPAAGALIWSMLAAVDVPADSRGLPVLLVVGLIAIAVTEPELEIAAALTATVAGSVSVAAAGTSTSLAVHLTVAGALVTASALVHADRRLLGWPGGALLAAATWVRLADLGVEAPEAYTLPSATALLVLGLLRLHRDAAIPTGRALGPGLLLATVPSLLWVLVDPVSARAVLLGAGCLVLVLVGARLRWSAPLLVGSGVGAVLVLRELAPYAATVPQWVLIGIAGTLLTVVGITWESRLRDLRTTTGYLRRLR